ncbi:MAG: NAD(P)H-hydrate dehydratase, partial [Verrucomicrobia bacterium]|nr:NAD(P)H-hydrate dehydratase [Verrucomicrobiota bacterium]
GVVIGPGLSPDVEMRDLLAAIFERVKCPVVLDADGLNVLAMAPELRPALQSDLVLTPHPGEMARLMGECVDAIQSNRRRWADAAAQQWNAVVVHKGAGTLVSAPGKTSAINLTGNPGMARGGMGDALAGLIGGLVAQGIPVFEAATLGVYLHGRAGDRVAWASSQAGMTTGDVIEELACTFAELSPR